MAYIVMAYIVMASKENGFLPASRSAASCLPTATAAARSNRPDGSSRILISTWDGQGMASSVGLSSVGLRNVGLRNVGLRNVGLVLISTWTVRA